MTPKLSRILFVAPNWLGDAVMSLPLLGSVGSSTGVSVSVLARPSVARVYWGLPSVDDLLVFPKSSGLGRIAQLTRAIRQLKFDGCLLLPPSFSSALVPFLARIPNRVGVASDGRTLLLGESIPDDKTRETHLADTYLRLGRVLLARLGVSIDDAAEPSRIHVFAGERESVYAALRLVGGPVEDFAVVVPGATYGPTKAWPANRYREMVAGLSREMSVVLAGTANEHALCEQIASGLDNVCNIAGLTTLGELMALLEMAEVVVANDSGAPHAAASIGTPVVVIFGSTSPQWTRPHGTSVHVVREPVHCAPCFLRECPTQLECFDGIHAQQVLEKTLAAVQTNALLASRREV